MFSSLEKKSVRENYRLPRLFNIDSKNQIRFWEVHVRVVDEDGSPLRHPTIVSEYGQLGGVIQTAELVVYSGKNIGKSNETSQWEQARLEARSMWEKKKKANYSEELGGQRRFLPMLAARLKERQTFINFKDGWSAQPKLNGNRSVATVGKNSVTHTSKLGNVQPTLSYIEEAIISRFPSGIRLDGELYRHGMSLQEINKRVKRFKSSRADLEEDVQYHIYDMFDENNPNLSFIERYDFLKKVFEKHPHEFLILVETLPIHSFDEATRLHDHYVENGYEGLILRANFAIYRPDYRSPYLVKMKQFEDAEFKIIGGHEGSGKDEDTVIFECITEDGKEFSVRPKGSWHDRHNYLVNLKSLIGKKLTVRYPNFTDDGIPFQPVGIIIRDYE